MYAVTAYKYWQNRFNYCTVKNEITELDGNCENWTKKEISFDLSKERFDTAENDIKIIGECLKDMINLQMKHKDKIKNRPLLY